MSRLERVSKENQYEPGEHSVPALNVVAREETTPVTEASLEGDQQLLDRSIKPIPPLSAHGIVPKSVIEYDLATILTPEQWQAHGTDGNKRMLLFPLEGEDVQTFWQELKTKIKFLKEDQALFIRMDRVHLYMQTTANLVSSLFHHDAEGGGWARRKKVVFVNPDESTMQQIYFAMEVKNELCMLLQAEHTDQPENWKPWYVCKPQLSLKAILDLLYEHQCLTSNDIVRLDPSITDVQRRLKILHELGLISRTSSTGLPLETSASEKEKAFGDENPSERLIYTYSLFSPCMAYVDKPVEELLFHVYDPLTVERAHGLLQVAENASKYNKLEKAEENAKRSLKLYEAIGDRGGMASCLFLLGVVSRFKRKKEEALAYHERSYKIRTHLNDEHALADSLHNMGLIYAERETKDKVEQQSFDKACLDFYAQALELREKIGDFLKSSATLNNMANKHAFRREFDKAFEYDKRSLARAIEGAVTPEDKQAIARSFLSFAMLAELEEEWERVIVLITIGTGISNKIKFPLPPLAQEDNARRLEDAAKKLNDPGQHEAAIALGTRLTPKEPLAEPLTEAINYACKRDG